MNDAPLTRIHRAEEKRQAGRADSVGGVARHGSEFSLAHRAEAVNVADKALTFREAAREGLIDEVFDRVEQFAALASRSRESSPLMFSVQTPSPSSVSAWRPKPAERKM